MNKDEVVSLVTKILLMVLTPIAVQHHVSGDNVTAFVTDGVDMAVLAYGVYSHWNMKKVPETAVIAPTPTVTK